MITVRGVSSVVSVILMVAVVVVLASTVSVLALGFTERFDEPAPNVAQTSGEFVPGGASDEQEVLLTHVAGDRVQVEDIEIIVRASGPEVDTEARLVNLPADGKRVETENIRGNADLIDKSGGLFGNPPDRVIVDADPNVWAAGDTIRFRVSAGAADFRKNPKSGNPDADKLEVIVIYTTADSGTILYQDTFRPE